MRRIKALSTFQQELTGGVQFVRLNVKANTPQFNQIYQVPYRRPGVLRIEVKPDQEVIDAVVEQMIEQAPLKLIVRRGKMPTYEVAE